MKEKKYAAKAFVSCSLRHEDMHFVDFICRVLDAHNIQPFGTVGKFSASPENPILLMKRNIEVADFVVICATPRYNQQDIKTGIITKALSEMVHVETGMALAYGKPVVVFVKEGTDVGHVFPSITQYVVLNESQDDYSKKSKLIFSLLNNAYLFVQKIKEKENTKAVKDIAIKGLAIIGGIAILDAIFNKD